MNRRYALVLLAAALASPVVPAQQAVSPKLATLPRLKSPVKVLDTGKWGFAYTAIDGLRDRGESANNPELPPVAALRGFLFAFRNGDHKFRRMGLLADGLYTHVAFADQNGDDPFRVNATWSTFGAGHAGEVSAVGGGKFDVPLGPKPAGNFTLVLRGFEFRRKDGTDANVRNIGIKLDGARNIAQVSLIDDQGTDFRALAETLGALAVAGATGTPGVIETITVREYREDSSFGTRSVRNPPGMVGQYRGYSVVVQYAWIPNALVKHTRALAGAGHRTIPPLLSPIDALTGFEFTFDNSDHHLLAIGVNGDGGSLGTEYNGFKYQDNNQDDPTRWTATYVTLDRSKLGEQEQAEMVRVQAQAREASRAR